MDKKQYEMDVAIKALTAAAEGIGVAVDQQTINGDQVHALLVTIANQMQLINRAEDLASN